MIKVSSESSNEDNLKHIASFDDVARFHGHVCPGLTIGYIAAQAAIEKLGSKRDIDEELVAIVENDACGVDAVQVITGCTIGKGNLIYQDHGKQVFTIISRNNNKAVRVALKSSFDIDSIDPEVSKLRPKVMSNTVTEQENKEFAQRMNKISQIMRNTPVEEMFDIKFVDVKIPHKARIFNSIMCSKCKEMVAESRIRVQNSEYVCIPCYEAYSRGW